MFDDMTPPMVRPEKPSGNIVEPKVSTNPDAPKIQRPLMVPPKKPEAPKVEDKVEVNTAPPQIPVQEDGVTPKRESAIKGPKSMPALPAQSVDKQVLFNGDEGANEPTIFERQQMKAQKESSAKKDKSDPIAPINPVVPRPEDTSSPVQFERGQQGAMKRSIPFEPGQIRLSKETTNDIAAGVVKELDTDGRDAWRVQIKSFATPHGDGISSDRRIALARALSLRSSLITQGVEANRIDVVSQGDEAQGTAPAADRIDLYLYGPKEP